jgi:hypothetical protein
MSSENVQCQHPELLKGKPGECSREQMQACHELDASHPAPPPSNEEILKNLRSRKDSSQPLGHDVQAARVAAPLCDLWQDHI